MYRKSKQVTQIPFALIFALSFCIGWSGDVFAEAATRQALVTNVLRVCADPNNLPYSSKTKAGFENKIAQLIADELGVSVEYTWWPQTIGFVRNTLRLRKCDLIVGMSTTNELVQNTNPYYRSVYTMVYRRDSGISATQLDDPELADKRFGVVAGTPPATILALNGMIGQAKGYQLFIDTREVSVNELMIDDLIDGEIDVALMWGASAGYFSSIADQDLIVVPLLNENPNIRLDFRISMALRYQETEWKRTLNRSIRKLQPEINSILQEYNIPLLDEKGELIASVD